MWGHAQGNPFRVQVRDNGVEAVLLIAAGAASSNESELRLQLDEALRVEGVTHGIVAEARAEAMKRVAEGQVPAQFVIARWTPPVHGDEGGLAREGDWSCPFLEGMVVGRAHSAGAVKAGTTVTGAPVPARVGHGRPATAGHGIRALRGGTPAGGTFVAAHYGFAQEEAGKVILGPLLRIAPDGLSVTTDIHPVLADKNPLGVEAFARSLSAEGVRIGVDEAAVAEACAKAAASGAPVHDVVVARGKAPSPGHDGGPEWLFKAGDWVRPGAVVAKKLPPRPGEAGQRVTGEKIPAAPVKSLPFFAGRGLAMSKDGHTLVAQILGVLHPGRGTLDLEAPLRIDPQHRSATMDLPPHDGRGEGVTHEDVLHTLRALGVVAGIQEKAIREALAEAQRSGRARDRVVVAKAEPAAVAANGRLETDLPLSDDKPPRWAALAAAGQRIGRILPPVEARAGVLVDGKAIPATPCRTVPIEVGPGLKATPLADPPGAFEAHAEAQGYLLRTGYRVWLDPLVELTPDAVSASLTLYPPPPRGAGLTLEALRAAVAAKGVVAGLDARAVEEALREVERTGQPVLRRAIATGQPAADGQDARLELLLDLQQKAGEEDESGRVDFHRRGLIHNVRKGQRIARKVAATQGTPGRTVTGLPLPAAPGKDIAFRAGPNVTQEPGGGAFLADINGLVILEGEEIRVDESVVLEKDVDFSTGAIDAEGSVHVRGTVRSTFFVKSRGAVRVDGAVEKARVEARGSVDVLGGVLGGEVRSGKLLRCGFAENAILRGEEDVEVMKECMKCDVRAGVAIRMTAGKGAFVGGRLLAGGQIDVKVLGSEAEAPTEAWAGYDFRMMDLLAEKIAAMRKREEELTRRHGVAPHAPAGGAAPHPELADLHAIREGLARLHAHFVEALAKAVRELHPTILIRTVAHPRTVLRIGEASLDVKAELRGPALFRLDAEGRTLVRAAAR